MAWWNFFWKKKVQEQQPLPKYRCKTGLALSGGGMRGFTHLGALKAFEEADIEFDVVAGTSVGSLMAALYCAGYKTDYLIEAAKDIKTSDIRSKNYLVPGRAEKVGNIFTKIAGDMTFDQMKRKLIVVTCDLVTGKECLFTEGMVAPAISASCAVPLVFSPVISGEKHLVDGGLLNNIPADVTRMFGAEEVISVDINPTRGNGTDSLKMMDILSATLRIMIAGSSEKGLRHSSIVISPDTSKFSSFSKDGYEEMIKLGYEAAKQKIPEIKELILSKEAPQEVNTAKIRKGRERRTKKEK